MLNLKKALPIALALTTALVGTTANAKSISGSVDFRVTLPEVLVLYHWDDAHLILTDVATTEANDSDTREISDATTRELTAGIDGTSHTITGSGAVNRPTIANIDNGKVEVTLKDAWAVRALSKGDVTLKVEAKNPLLKNVTENASTITVSDTKLVTSSSAVTTKQGTTLTLPSKWTETMGDINFKIDLTNAKSVGQYNTRGSNANNGVATTAQENTDVFLLTLTGEVPPPNSP
ncbi:MAG: hypothetical protein Q4B81_01015 [Moraxella sp.]|nr:hypothetical protein [Moraxella sp.]